MQPQRMARIKYQGHIRVCHRALDGLVKILLKPISTSTEADGQEAGLRLSVRQNKAFPIHSLPGQPLAPESLANCSAHTAVAGKTPLVKDWPR